MNLGVFSLSIRVKDIEKSLRFYESLGFRVLDGGHVNQVFPDTGNLRWRILEQDSLKIGLFQGMIDENIITFHPENVPELQDHLKNMGLEFEQEVDDSDESPSAAVLRDPDGNLIMFDRG